MDATEQAYAFDGVRQAAEQVVALQAGLRVVDKELEDIRVRLAVLLNHLRAAKPATAAAVRAAMNAAADDAGLTAEGFDEDGVYSGPLREDYSLDEPEPGPAERALQEAREADEPTVSQADVEAASLRRAADAGPRIERTGEAGGTVGSWGPGRGPGVQRLKG